MIEHDVFGGPEVEAKVQFITALAKGSNSAAAEALRTLASLDWRLEGDTLEILADQFEGLTNRSFPFMLQFKRPRKGRPRLSQEEAGWRRIRIERAVEDARSKPNMNRKAAINEVSKRMGLCQATVKQVYYDVKKRKKAILAAVRAPDGAKKSRSAKRIR